MQIAKIAVEAATYAIDKPYSYGVPAGMDVSVGCRVLVPFGRGNRTSEGIVLSLEECLPNGPLKALRLNLDGAPVISPREIKLAFWMRQRYFCTFYDAIRTVLPAAVWYRYQAPAWQYRLSGVVRERGGGLPASSGRAERTVCAARGLWRGGCHHPARSGKAGRRLPPDGGPPQCAGQDGAAGSAGDSAGGRRRVGADPEKIRAPYVRCGAVPVTARRDRRT